jgi:hypothetical protein
MKKFSTMARAGVVATLAALALAAAGCSAARTAATSPERAEAEAATAAHVARMLDKRLYKVDFSRAMPMGAPSFQLLHPYFISVVGDHVESMLPYMGRAYSLPYGGGEGLRFRAPVTDYRDRVTGRKARREITFTARTGEDAYRFALEVFPSGECTLTITPTNKQTISFIGAIDQAPEFEAVRVSE